MHDAEKLAMLVGKSSAYGALSMTQRFREGFLECTVRQQATRPRSLPYPTYTPVKRV
jgi:hypothetical protein